MVGGLSRLGYAALGLLIAVDIAPVLAQNRIEYDCAATRQSLALSNPGLRCTCSCATCKVSCSQGSGNSPGGSHPGGLTPSQAFETQLIGGLLDQLINSVFSSDKPDTALIEQRIVEEQARQQQALEILRAEWQAQQYKSAINRQQEQDQRLQQGNDLLTAMHGGEGSTPVQSPGGTIEGFKWDTPSDGKVGPTSLSVGRYDTSGLKSWQRLACAADFSKKAQAVQDSNPEQARYFNDQAARVSAGGTIEIACSFSQMPHAPELPAPSAQMQQTEKYIHAVQLDLKELHGLEIKVQKIQTDKSAAQEKVKQAEAACQHSEADKVSAKPEDAALMAEIMRRQAEAQAQLDDANQKLRALSNEEQELSRRKEAIYQELQQIQQQNKSGQSGVPN